MAAHPIPKQVENYSAWLFAIAHEIEAERLLATRRPTSAGGMERAAGRTPGATGPARVINLAAERERLRPRPQAQPATQVLPSFRG